MRVAIVSDTHAFLSPAVLAIVETCDMAVHAGDIGSRQVLELLQAVTGRVIAVCGNNDLPELWEDTDIPTNVSSTGQQTPGSSTRGRQAKPVITAGLPAWCCMPVRASGKSKHSEFECAIPAGRKLILLPG
jgi:hypothetical protein